MKHTAGKNLVLTDYSSRHPTEKTTTEETHDEEYGINILSELFKINHKNGKFLKTDRNFRPTDYSTHMTLTANQPLKLLHRKNSIRT